MENTCGVRSDDFTATMSLKAGFGLLFVQSAEEAVERINTPWYSSVIRVDGPFLKRR